MTTDSGLRTTRRRPAVEAYTSASTFGTFGELLQGALPDGPDFLVTMPIARWSTARFLLDPSAAAVHVRPARKVKSRRLVDAMLRRYGVTAGGVLYVDSELPEGKGLASSSADMVATAAAVGRAIGIDPGPAVIEDLLRPIEPSDGVMHHGVVAFAHREVRLYRHLGHLPPLTVVGIDEGGQIETVAFNQRPKAFTRGHRRTYQRLLDTLGDAVLAGDARTIGDVATRSALMNQRLCPKRCLDDMIAICAEVGGAGVVTAHSGTALGILLDRARPGYAARLERTRLACARLAGTVWVDHCLPGFESVVDSRAAYLPGGRSLSVSAGS